MQNEEGIPSDRAPPSSTIILIYISLQLRCDIEGNSCEKCIEAGVTCSYNSTRAGSENRSSCSAEGVIQRPDSPPTGECIAVINRPDNRPAAPSPPPPDAGLHDNLPSGATHPHFGSNSSGDEGEQGVKSPRLILFSLEHLSS